MAQIIAISNQKGGVGKTTTSVNLAASLAVAEHRVLLIDMDPQSNACSGLGILETQLKQDIYQVLVDEVPFSKIIKPTELKYLHLAPSSQNLIGAEVELVSVIGREARLKEALSSQLDNYDFIIIDCPPALGILTVNALSAAHSVLIPLQTEYYALEGLSQLMKTIQLIQKRLNQRLKLEGILLTMYDKRNKLCKDVEHDVRNAFKDKVFDVIIPRNIKLSEAPSFGKPCLLYDVSSKGSLSYLQLAREIIIRHSTKQASNHTPKQPLNNKSVNNSSNNSQHNASFDSYLSSNINTSSYSNFSNCSSSNSLKANVNKPYYSLGHNHQLKLS